MARSLIRLAFDAGFSNPRANPFLALHRDASRLFDDAPRGFGPAGDVPTAPPRMNVGDTGPRTS